MKGKAELVRGWLRKAFSDLAALDASLQADALDAACFHAQQAAEKFLKAFLIHNAVDFPFTHNLSKLVDLCSACDAVFGSVKVQVASLTPYAVELRYDHEFWPGREVAEEARLAALAVREVVLKRLPEDIVAGIG